MNDTARNWLGETSTLRVNSIQPLLAPCGPQIEERDPRAQWSCDPVCNALNHRKPCAPYITQYTVSAVLPSFKQRPRLRTALRALWRDSAFKPTPFEAFASHCALKRHCQPLYSTTSRTVCSSIRNAYSLAPSRCYCWTASNSLRTIALWVGMEIRKCKHR